MSQDNRKGSISDCLVLEDSDNGGVVVSGITNDGVTTRSGLRKGDEIVAATIHLDHLRKDEVLKILQVLEPYDENMKVMTKQELKASASLSSLDPELNGNVEIPAPSLRTQDLSMDTSLVAPNVEVGGLNGQLNTVGLGLGDEVSVPTLNGELKEPDTSVSIPQFSTSNLAIETSKAKTGGVKYKPPKFAMPNYNLPHFKAKVPKGDVNVSADLESPVVSADIDPSDLNLSPPAVDVSTPEVNVNGPNIEKPGWHYSNWKVPKIGLPKADMDANLRTPDADFSAPEIEGDISAPAVDVSLPNTNIEGPNIDVQSPDIDIGTKKINWPHKNWKKPKFGLQGPKVDADIDAEIKASEVSASLPEANVNVPAIDGNLPKVDLDAPNVDVQIPAANLEAKPKFFNWPHKNWKKPNLGWQGIKSDVDFDPNLTTPDANLDIPKIEGDISAPDVDLNLPKADLEVPNVVVQTPTIDADIQTKKRNWPHKNWKMPKFGVNTKAPDITADVDTPELYDPKVDAEIGPPSVDLDLPKGGIDVTAPKANLPSPTVKFPTIKKPKLWFTGPRIKAPEVDVHVDDKTPDLNLDTSQIEASLDAPKVAVDLPGANITDPELNAESPNIDMKASSKKFRLPHIKKPNWTLSGPKGTDVDAGLSIPKVDGEIIAPDVNLDLPKADLEAPKVDVETQNLNLEPPEKPKWFTLKKPKFGTLKLPKVEADVNTPDLDVNGLDVNAPKVEADVNAPSVNASLPDVDIEGAGLKSANIHPPSEKFTLGKLKLPKIKGLKRNGLDLDMDAKTPDIDLPESNIETPNADLSLPDASISLPKINGNIDVPELDIAAPKAELGIADVDLKTTEPEPVSGRFGLPKIKVPKINSKAPTLKVPNLLNLDASVGDVDIPKTDLELKPDLNLSAPTIEGGISAKDIDINLPKSEIDGSDIELQNPVIDLEADKFRSPTLSLTEIGVPKRPDLDVSADIKAPNADVSVPYIADAPKVDLQSPDLLLDPGDLSLSTSMIEREIPTSNIDINLPNSEIKGTDVELQAPIDLDTNDKSKLGNLKLPKIGLPKVKRPDQALDQRPSAYLNTPNAELSVPNVDVGVTKADLVGDLNTPNVDADVKTSKLPHFHLPKFGLSQPKVKAEIDADAKIDLSPDLKVLPPTGEITSPEVGISAPEVEANLDQSEINIKADENADAKDSPKSKKWRPFRWLRRDSKSGEEDGSGVDSDTEALDLPTFKFHTLPRNGIDDIQKASGRFDDSLMAKFEDRMKKEQAYTIVKGVRIPTVNASSNTGDKISIMERLRMAKEKTPSINSSLADTNECVSLASVDVDIPTNADDSTVVRGGTFKVAKADSGLDLEHPIVAQEEHDKMSLSLSNMLGLNIKEKDTD